MNATYSVTVAKARCKCMACKKPIEKGTRYVIRQALAVFDCYSPDRFHKECAVKWPDEKLNAIAREA
jgi:hypothetical protein